MQSERTNECMTEHDPLMGVYTKQKTERVEAVDKEE